MTRRALVTGGTRGIGAAIAEKLRADGFDVIVCDVSADALARYEATTGIGGVSLDVSDYDDARRGVATIEAAHGPIDILVNNAGITRDGMMHKMDPVSQWRAVIDVNLTGVFNMCRAVTPGMRERGYGRVINISSMNGLRGQFGQANYAAAKAGVIGFTKSIAQELAGKGVTANCIAPGFIETEMTQNMKRDVLDAERAKIPVGRMGRPDDIAATASFLASDAAAFVTGETISVNGGQLMS